MGHAYCMRCSGAYTGKNAYAATGSRLCQACLDADESARVKAYEQERDALYLQAMRAVVASADHIATLTKEVTALRGELANMRTDVGAFTRLVATKEEAMAKEDTMKVAEETTMSRAKARAAGALGIEVPAAAWRVAGRKAIDRSIAPAIAALVKADVLSRENAGVLAKHMKRPVVSGIYGVAIGTALTAHPRASSKPWLAKLASEMRIEGWARIGEAVVDPVLDALEKVFFASVADAGIEIGE